MVSLINTTMKNKYTYATSEKSFLDDWHDSLWDDGVKWIHSNYPHVTPNQVTLAGGIPVILLSLLNMFGIIGSLVYPLLAILIVWYLNFDAMDGKLARYMNRSSPIGQVLDHGLDTIVGCFLGVMITRFLGLESFVFSAIGIVLSSLLFHFCTLKEHLTQKILVSIKISTGKRADDYVVVSTTEVLYGISAFLMIGYIVFYGSIVLPFLIAMILIGSLIYILDHMYLDIMRSTVHAREIEDVTPVRTTRSSGRYDRNSSDSSDSTGSAGSAGSAGSMSNSNEVRKRKQIYDANMRPTGEYMEFDFMPERRGRPSSGSGAGISVRDPAQTSSTRRFVQQNLFDYALIHVLSILSMIMSAGSVIQTVMMIMYVSFSTINLIFLNTLRLDRFDQKSRITIDRFVSDCTPLVMLVMKLIAMFAGVLMVITGVLDSTRIMQNVAVFIDIGFLAYAATELYDKKRIVEDYFD